MKYKNKIIAPIFVGSVFLVMLVFYFLYGFAPAQKEVKKTTFLIQRGESFFDIGANLDEEGIIKSKFSFNIYTLFSRQHSQILAGKYLLSPSMDIKTILQKFILGDIIKEEVTILSGWNLREIAAELGKQGLITAQEQFFVIAGDPENKTPAIDFSGDFTFLADKPKSASLEGYLFPDTYEIDSGGGVEFLTKKMLANFGKKVTSEMQKEITKQDKTLFEILTMASIVEKEVRTYQEKQIVAGILWKRLKQGWPLQVDSTLDYILDKSSAELTREDLKSDIPYNTYVKKGLPPGPISSPDIESIKATIYYTDSPYWYYLSTRSGATIFSKTFEEHKAAKAKYLW